MSDLTKPFKTLLVEMINEVNPDGTQIKAADFTVGAPTASSAQPGKNTALVVTGEQTAGYTGTQTVYYNRLDIGSDIGATGDRIFDAEGKTKVSHVITEFNARFKTNLVAGKDYTEADLPTFAGNPGEQHDVIVTMLAGSEMFINSVTLTVKIATRDIAEVIVNNNLNGLTYEP